MKYFEQSWKINWYITSSNIIVLLGIMLVSIFDELASFSLPNISSSISVHLISSSTHPSQSIGKSTQSFNNSTIAYRGQRQAEKADEEIWQPKII